MSQPGSRSIVASIVGGLTLAAGLAAFLDAVQRLGGLLGMFGDGPGPETITLRLDPCP